MKKFTLLVTVFFLSLAAGTSHALTNRTKDNPSPYIALHGEDAIAWQEWNEQTLALAREQNKLIFLSVGFFSCQGCHKMHGETEHDAEIARMLNEHFIPVIVDRELMTALDDELQAYALRKHGMAGWPLNVFITPEGHPIAVVFYANTQQFLQTLSYAQMRWDTAREKIMETARNEADVRLAYQPKAVKLTPAVANKYREKLLAEVFEQADLHRGGFGSGSKHTMPPLLDTLLEMYRRKPDAKLGDYLKTWLDQMAGKGLYDHLDGGFFRYTADAEWHDPHYEKMLADNALLASIYLKAAEIFNRPHYRQVAFGTLDFFAAQMMDDKAGGFMASSSGVDDQRRPGAYYQWSKDELKRLLTPREYEVAARVWDMDRHAALAYGYLPVNLLEPDEAERKVLQDVRRKLSQARAKRVLERDAKLVASSNGLALRAYSEAARIDSRYAPIARKVRDFAANTLWRDGKLAKASRDGRIVAQGELEDYAFMAAGFMEYAKLSGSEDDRRIADELATAAWQSFHDAKGWKAQKRSLLAGSPYRQLIEDGAETPSPSAVLIGVSLQSGDGKLAARGARALETGHEILDGGVFWHATQVGLMQRKK